MGALDSFLDEQDAPKAERLDAFLDEAEQRGILSRVGDVVRAAGENIAAGARSLTPQGFAAARGR